ncbi:helix-turn-helix domain-containing protein [Kiritimatiella glycovorans]|uniref:HTH cro/C1-type domain-containing protein n=1 Tax=Kiritimatiella glycovorans TaxID=1307763 RepID=A0A0G3EDK2_9BACT|nr:helix-turn-helix domain-containing protein [Kiritimatiella glycovorans]AKJ63467.1 hypothetical protein L21SP4_00183 [Kiritimatiella glycovorans]
MKSVSEQLRARRIELGLTLADAARRAGTSAATLSRYEHGWSRFETYTLNKLARALDCELRITLEPEEAGEDRPAPGIDEAVQRLARLFWDRTLSKSDLERYPVWVAERVLDYGNLEDVRMLRALLGRESFVRAAARAHRVSNVTRNFWKQILMMEGVPCTNESSRSTAWNS